MKAEARQAILEVIDQDVPHVKQDLSKPANMARAQKLLRNVKAIRSASVEGEDVPFDVLESFAEGAVRKYNFYISHIIIITDVKGGMTYSGGCTKSGKLPNGKPKQDWLFTVHASTLYALFVKLCLGIVLCVKDNKLEERVNWTPKTR